MPRKTQLRLLSERAVPNTDGDDRQVVEAFPAAPPPAQNQAFTDDILDVLRKSHERMAGEVRQATAVATAAVERVSGLEERLEVAESAAGATVAKIDLVQKQTEVAGQAVLAQVSTLLATNRDQARQTAASFAIGLGTFSERFSRVLMFALERAPALLALAAAVWLWNRVLVNPTPLQLTALGLFGAVVIAPAMWLGRCGDKKDAS